MAFKGSKKIKAYGLTGLVDIFPEPIITTRAPVNGADSAEDGQIWIDTTGQDAYLMVDKASQTWINAGGGSGSFATLSVTGAVTFSALGLGVVQSSAAGVLSSSDGTNGQLLIAATGAGAPAWANITSGDASVTITNGANTIDLSVPVTAAAFDTDAGTANPAAGNLDIFGGTNVNTAGAGNVVTINVDNNPTFSGLLTGQAGLDITAGTTTITSDTNAADAIYLHANGGVNETIRLHSDQGSSADSVNILSDVGGITLQSVGLATDNAINLEADAGGIDMDAALQINIASSEAAVDAIRLNASNAAGGIDVDDAGGGMTFDSVGAISLDAAAASNFSVSGAGVDLTLASAAGRVQVQGDEATADALRLLSTAGGMDVDVALQMNMVSSQSAADAIRMNASDAAGGMDIDAGTGGIAVDSTGAISLDGAAASNFSVSGVGIDLTLASSGGRVVMNGEEAAADALRLLSAAGGLDADVALQMSLISSQAAADAIRMQASNAAGGLDLDTGTGGIIADTTGAISLDSAAASNFTVTGAFDLTLDSSAGSVNISAGEAAADAINIDAAAGGLDVDVALQMNLTSSQAAADAIRINASNAAGGIDIDDAGGGITVDSAAGISIDAATASNMTCAAGDLTLQATTGSVNVNALEDAAQSIYLHANGGTSETIEIHADQGTGEDAVYIHADDGGVLLLSGVNPGGLGVSKGIILYTDANISQAILIKTDGGTDETIHLFNDQGTGLSSLRFESTAGGASITTGINNAQAIYLHANGGTSETIDIHSDQGTGDTSVNVHSDAGGITLNSGIGAVLMTPQTNSVAGTSLTLNARVGVATFTGQTTGAGSNLDLTITNSEVTQGCGVFVTVSNIGTNDADMTLEGVITQTAGTLTIHTQNNGAASLNGDVIVTFWIIN